MSKKFNFLVYLTLFVIVTGLVVTDTASAVPAGMYGWWRLNDGAGTIAKDSSGNGRDGTVNNPTAGLGTGGAVWVQADDFPAIAGGPRIVASFNGSNANGAYISGANMLIPAMPLTKDFTWVCWAKLNTGAGQDDVVIGNRNIRRLAGHNYNFGFY